MPVFQERVWRAEPDILAVDQEGRLYIFELKRNQSDSGNLLQVMGYAQRFGRFDYRDLNERFKKYQEKQGSKEHIRDLKDAHAEQFGIAEQRPEKALREGDFNQEQRFVVITAGLDIDTIEAVQYWREKGLPIEVKVFRVYEIDGKYFFDFDPYCPPEAAQYSQAETSNYIVNTNKTWDANAYKEMLDKQQAAAFRDRKTSVDSIQKGDRVFLYHTGLGVIAAGQASDSFKVEDFEGDPNAKHYVPCSFDLTIDPGDPNERKRAVSAREINQKLGTGYRFRQTTFSISDGMADAIRELLNEKG